MAKKHTITTIEVQNLINSGVSTFSRKDNSPRGCETVSANEIQIGDKIVQHHKESQGCNLNTVTVNMQKEKPSVTSTRLFGNTRKCTLIHN